MDKKTHPFGYPEEKHPQVYVDMHGSDEEQPLLPSYSASGEAQPCTDEKPQPGNESPRRCSFRERWRARCARRCQRGEQCRERFRSKCRILRKIFALSFFAILFLSFFGDPEWFDCDLYRTKNKDVAVADPTSPLKTLTDDVFAGAMADDQCFNDLVTYTGPSKFTTEVTNVGVLVGKGNIVANAVIRVADVEKVTIEFKANVTKNFKYDDDDGDDDDGSDDDSDSDSDSDDEDDEDFKKKHKKHKKHKKKHPRYEPKTGLHVDVVEDDDSIGVTIWADKYVLREDEGDKKGKKKGKKHHRHRHHGYHAHDDEEYDHRYRKFCATVALEITIPASYKTLGSLNLSGVLLNTHTENLDNLRFGKLELGSVVGGITVSPVRADQFEAAIVTGNVNVESVQAATKGHRVNAKAAATAGNVKLNVKTSPIALPDDNSSGDESEDELVHFIHAAVVAGDVDLTVAPKEKKKKDEEEGAVGETVPGDVKVRAVATSGQVRSSIHLAKEQRLALASHSVSGSVLSEVSDSYTGPFKLHTVFGTTTLNEKEGSLSRIVYEKNMKSIKTGSKVVFDEEEQNEPAGIALSSTTGSVTVTFV